MLKKWSTLLFLNSFLTLIFLWARCLRLMSKIQKFTMQQRKNKLHGGQLLQKQEVATRKLVPLWLPTEEPATPSLLQSASLLPHLHHNNHISSKKLLYRWGALPIVFKHINQKSCSIVLVISNPTSSSQPHFHPAFIHRPLYITLSTQSYSASLIDARDCSYEGHLEQHGIRTTGIPDLDLASP